MDLYLISGLILTALCVAIVGYTYSNILTQPGEIFGKLYGKLDEFFQTDLRRSCQGKGPHPLFKMIMHCEKCVSGQLALWGFILFIYPDYSIRIGLLHILFIGLSIFFATIVKSIHEKLTNQ